MNVCRSSVVHTQSCKECSQSLSILVAAGSCYNVTVYRKSMLLNPFSVRYLRPEVQLMYSLRMHTRRHKKSPKMVSRVRNDQVVIRNGCAEFKYDVRF